MSEQFSQKELERSQEYIALKELENILNNCSNPARFAACIPNMHRTLQQNFFRMIKECILFMSTPGNVIIDDRNRASYQMCCEIAEMIRHKYLPLI